MSTLPHISALRDLDEDAWSHVATELFPVALAAAKTKLFGDFEEDARDVACRGLHILCEKVHQVESSDELPALLTTIVYGEAVDFLRRQQAAKRGGGRVFRFGVLEDWFDNERHFDEPGGTAESFDEDHISTMAEVVRKLSKVLSPKVRELLIDCYYHDKTSTEIARTRGMKPGAVRTALSRALKDLREQLSSHAELCQEARSLVWLRAKTLSLLIAFL